MLWLPFCMVGSSCIVIVLYLWQFCPAPSAYGLARNRFVRAFERAQPPNYPPTRSHSVPSPSPPLLAGSTPFISQSFLQIFGSGLRSLIYYIHAHLCTKFQAYPTVLPCSTPLSVLGEPCCNLISGLDLSPIWARTH